jgi:2-polyprenyl-6-methoxyphenol hydroxylase-like FAD-dependent oxidoreductase
MLWQAAVTGLHPDGALVAGELVRAKWAVGADGSSSRVRRWANLDRRNLFAPNEKSRRFAFRRHYRVVPWTNFMELHWGDRCQVYVTPVSSEEVCVALVSSEPNVRMRQRMEEALTEFPELSVRLRGAEFTSGERGAITMTRRLRRVHRGRTVLVGDASGGVDAITGQGLCLAFRQATLLAECLASEDLSRYESGHRALLRHPALMARLMLLMARHGGLRQRAMRLFQSKPHFFSEMLAMHVGGNPTRHYLSSGIALGRELLNA